MKMSWKIGEVRGISVNVHATFLILLGWIAMGQLQGGFQNALLGILFTISVFATIVLHELGHALAAARYGIPTRDITLWPIGGVARLERMPREPKEELVVALAGPAVNIALIVAFAILNNFISLFFSHYSASTLAVGFLSQLIWVNGFLALFNLLPAFPMDGGRVLRAFLAMRMSYLPATRIAASAGRMMSVLFGVAGFFILNQPMLVIIALFVWFAAGSEERMVAMQERFGNSADPFSSPRQGRPTVHNAFKVLRYQVADDEEVEDGQYWEEGKRKRFGFSFIGNMFPETGSQKKSHRGTDKNSRSHHNVHVVFR